MSSNHLKYDTCAYATTIKESTEPLEYWLYKGKYETCTPIQNADYSYNIEFPFRADVESELFGLTRLGTDCPSLKYDPTKPFSNPVFSPPIIGQSIYGITPSNLVNPKTNMLNENNLGVNLCSLPKPNIEKFTDSSQSPKSIPLALLLKGYISLNDSSVLMNLSDKVEDGVDFKKVLDSIIHDKMLLNIHEYYRKDITLDQINKLNSKFNQYLNL